MNGNFGDKKMEGGNGEQKEKPKQVVWIIDDSPALQEFMGEFLRMKGFEVRTFSSGENALEALGREKTPSVFIVDGNLGDNQMIGSEIVAKLGERNVDSLVIAHSSRKKDNELMEETARKFGIEVASFEKGSSQYNIDELAKVIKSFKS